MRARIAHQLRRRIKAHRLAVDQRGAKRRRLVMLQPCGGVDQEGEACGMTFRKAVFAKTQYLIEYLVSETFRVALRAHAIDQLLLERL
ncbi:MAG TPA: hypothetical protein VNH39_13755, partial [Steroidobacteraceae bacterium]|nr:hypothetical protein [Steroidobacteraceae bacterium]